MLLMFIKTLKADSVKDTLVIEMSDCGIDPGSFKDCTPAIQNVLREIHNEKLPVRLVFEKGTYHFYKKKASKAHYAITAVHQMWDFYTPFHLNKLTDVEIDGNGALFMMHGRMTPFVINECKNIIVRNVKIDQEFPSIHEMTVINTENNFIDFEVHQDTRYLITDGKFSWLDADGKIETFPNIWCKYDSNTSTVKREKNILKTFERIEEQNKGIIRVYFGAEDKPVVTENSTYQFRWHIRDQQGTVINRSNNVSLENVELYTTNGLGVVSQLSGNLCFKGFQLKPRPGSGRTAAGFADALHLYGVTGKLSVENCKFIGTHDDGMNIYNYYLKVAKTLEQNSLLLKFPCWEQCGFNPFFEGDSVLFRKSDNLVKVGANIIVKSKLVDKETVQVWLNGEVSELLEGTYIENITQIPDLVVIKNNHFERIATRGILMYTSRKSIIENNFFHRTPMPAILLKNPDDKYYLQGYTKDLTIRNNTFYECLGNEGGYEGPGDGVIHFKPQLENAEDDFYLYENVNISNNVFILKEKIVPMVKARRVSGLKVTENTVESSVKKHQLVDIENCTKIEVKQNYKLTTNK